MTKKDVEKFHAINERLNGIYNELAVLSKKSPNDSVNAFKLRIVNAILNDGNTFLKPVIPIPDFESFNDDKLPSNSDVLFVISQYIGALENFKKSRVAQNVVGDWMWPLDGQGHIKTSPPREFDR